MMRARPESDGAVVGGAEDMPSTYLTTVRLSSPVEFAAMARLGSVPLVMTNAPGSQEQVTIGFLPGTRRGAGRVKHGLTLARAVRRRLSSLLLAATIAGCGFGARQGFGGEPTVALEFSTFVGSTGCS